MTSSRADETCEELDLGFSASEVATAISELLPPGARREPTTNEGLRFDVSGVLTVEITSIPPERIRPPAFAPRSRVVLQGPFREVDVLRRRIRYRLLRVGG